MDKYLREFMNLPTLQQMESLLNVYQEKGYEGVKEVLRGLHLEELKSFFQNFKDFAVVDPKYNRLRGVIATTLQDKLEESLEEQGPTVNYGDGFVARLVELLREIGYSLSEPSLSRLEELAPEGFNIISAVPTPLYKSRMHPRYHYIITIENESGIHSFCWNDNTSTLIYGLDANPLDFLKFPKDVTSQDIREVIKQILDL